METDALGPVAVPDDALYGASTQRALDNLALSGTGLPPALIRALARIKAVAAEVNRELGLLDDARAALIARAAEEIAGGAFAGQFPVDVFHTGSGTSANMNLNEVIANRCAQLAGRPLGGKDPVHPNDHVNLGQSSNDVFPSALHLAAVLDLRDRLRPALAGLAEALAAKAAAWDDVVAVGRTHLQDATPIRLGQRFAGYAAQAGKAVQRVEAAAAALSELAIGGTAVGTGINAHPAFAARVCARLARDSGHPFREAGDHCEAQAARDGAVEASGQLKTIAIGLSRIANDLRLLASGPRCGLGELTLPALQPGSSIMPGKVNPVVCEAVIQVAVQVVGNDAAIACGGFGGVGSLLDLNTAMPVIARNLLESIALLAGAAEALVAKAVAGLAVERARCTALVEASLAMATGLVPAIGYDRAAAIAQQAWREGRTVREVAADSGIDAAALARLLDASAMTRPGLRAGGDG